ncbi:MAG TPA: hypothetical protein VK524_03365, partial [Polyangiaceae bacterium]|nr:hypothetical protein [Polyangiaceae bacterium]
LSLRSGSGPEAGTPTPQKTPTTATTATTAAPALDATGSASAAPAAGEVRFRVAVSPENAELRLDGRLLTQNPYDGVVKRDDTEHELSVSADRHKTQKRKLRFDSDIDLEIDLAPTQGSRAGRSARALRAATAAPRAPAPPPRAAAETPPPASAPPRAPQVEPGMDLRTRSVERVKRGIDEKDPYTQ